MLYVYFRNFSSDQLCKFTNYFSFRKIFAMKTAILENFEKTPHIGHLGTLNPHEYWAEDSNLFLKQVTWRSLDTSLL